jgi:predicted GIY-YIG superfamily endonuclease
MEKYYSYVLKNEVNGHFYKGSTSNLEKRLEWHNSGLVKYTSFSSLEILKTNPSVFPFG